MSFVSEMSDKELMQYDENRTASKQFTIIENVRTDEFFFTIDHCQRLARDGNISGDGWVAVSFSLPSTCVPRSIVPDGLIKDVETWLKVYMDDGKEVPNPNPRYTPAFRKKEAHE